MTIAEIADLIGSPCAETLFDGNYRNKRKITGYFIQIKCGAHWCKVSVSHVQSHHSQIAAIELHSITPAYLTKGDVVPIPSIVEALRSGEGRSAELLTYPNSSGIVGLWTEFRYRNNWYMLSVSHIDIPRSISSSRLDVLADQFLLQQAGMGKRGFDLRNRFDRYAR